LKLVTFRSEPFKEKIVNLLKAEGENWLGCGMTYTLFECIKEPLAELLIELEEEVKNAKLTQVADQVKNINLAPVIKTSTGNAPVEPPKKEQMTKSQKRKMWDKADNKGHKPRGWDWIDIVKHLSQTGYSKDDSSAVQGSSFVQQPLAPPPNNY